MPTLWGDVLQAAASLLAVLVAAIAILIAIKSEARVAERFEAEMRLQEKIARSSVKPVLAVFTEFTDNTGVVLLNCGLGTAVIDEIVFTRGDKASTSLPPLFDLPSSLVWDQFWEFRPRKYYLAADKRIDLIRLTASKLRESGFSEEAIADILESWQDQMPGISVRIRYEDVLGNSKDDYETVLE
jgi:hypothetical protein